MRLALLCPWAALLIACSSSSSNTVETVDGGGGGAAGTAGTGGAAGASGSSGSSGSTGRWPDSATVNCTDVTPAMECPTKGEDYYGQDGNFEIHVPSYAVSGPELSDSVTGFVWRAGTGAANQADAAAGCASLGADWHLPSFLELSSLLDFGVSQDAVPTAVKNGASSVWTATPAPVAGSIWTISTVTGVPTMQAPTDVLGSVCVSGPAITAELGTPKDGVVQDARTGLYWQTVTVAHRNWKDALSYCLQTQGAGWVTGWRLPTVKELLTIASPDQFTAIDTDVFGTSALVWSSTPTVDNGADAWIVEFVPLQVVPRNVTLTAELRCVHDPS